MYSVNSDEACKWEQKELLAVFAFSTVKNIPPRWHRLIVKAGFPRTTAEVASMGQAVERVPPACPHLSSWKKWLAFSSYGSQFCVPKFLRACNDFLSNGGPTFSRLETKTIIKISRHIAASFRVIIFAMVELSVTREKSKHERMKGDEPKDDTALDNVARSLEAIKSTEVSYFFVSYKMYRCH